MQLIGSSNVMTNQYVSFNTIIANWAAAGSDYLISYDEASSLFNIPYASANDYWVSWKICLKTANLPDVPIIGLELIYNSVSRRDYILAPLKTLQISNTSLYHISDTSPTDMLSIGLKVFGPDHVHYTLASESTCNIAASLFIMGL